MKGNSIKVKIRKKSMNITDKQKSSKARRQGQETREDQNTRRQREETRDDKMRRWRNKDRRNEGTRRKRGKNITPPNLLFLSWVKEGIEKKVWGHVGAVVATATRRVPCLQNKQWYLLWGGRCMWEITANSQINGIMEAGSVGSIHMLNYNSPQKAERFNNDTIAPLQIKPRSPQSKTSAFFIQKVLDGFKIWRMVWDQRRQNKGGGGRRGNRERQQGGGNKAEADKLQKK